MPVRLTASLLAFAIGAAAAQQPKEPAGLGDKVIAFAAGKLGEQVGDGQCAALANHALRAAGARGRGPDDPDEGDYTWGKLVLALEAGPRGPKPTGKPGDIQPGDVIQFRDTKWVSKRGNRTYTMTMPHHTAIVQKVEDKGATLRILHQNFGGKKVVQEATLPLATLTEGWIRVYHPIPAGK